MALLIESFFDQDTATFTYVLADDQTKKAAVIDSVLNYNMSSGRTQTHAADRVIQYITSKNLSMEWILDTHIHADHLTASHYLKEKIGGKIGIGSKIKDVLSFWVPIFNTAHDTPLDGSQFDRLFDDGDIFQIGSIHVHVMHTPGHTPACICYHIKDAQALFVGDTIFMPDLGTARTDFPGGSAEQLYDSIQKILSLPDETRIFVGHDDPPTDHNQKLTRNPMSWTTVKDQKDHNQLVKVGIGKDEYVSLRHQRDHGKAVPRLLLPSLQVNLRAGTFGVLDDHYTQYIKIPINKI